MKSIQLVAFLATIVAASSWAMGQGAQLGSGRGSVTGLGTAGTGQRGQGAQQNGQRTEGLQQTGQLQSEAAIQRDANEFVGGAQGNILSRSGAQNGAGGGNLLGGLGQLGLATGGIGRGGIGGLGALGGTRGGFGGGLGGFQQGLGNQAGGQNGRGTNGAPQLRVSVSVGFEAPEVSSTQISSQFESRLMKIPQLDLQSPVSVKMDGRTAVLQGAVESQHQRELAERLARLEPGISDVRNELTVQPAEEVPELLPPAANLPPSTD